MAEDDDDDDETDWADRVICDSDVPCHLWQQLFH
jgi:hypothetical protein